MRNTQPMHKLTASDAMNGARAVMATHANISMNMVMFAVVPSDTGYDTSASNSNVGGMVAPAKKPVHVIHRASTKYSGLPGSGRKGEGSNMTSQMKLATPAT
eukprot:gnl/MRDRNA2_/MRDRNA2_22494_c0_seq1.p2 gnl/MRDRNA2_/MRDRNA2_22494_c0~~gnl/MRDRNA2_/MRDRNA2_22494_c0_seq1.p2  ORF type:complete len:102 (+),score=13.58 gnl/MRDRNA2_/MRDRNA2_22494_c0_seq1:1-306(+)